MSGLSEPGPKYVAVFIGVCRPTAALRPLADALASPCGPRLAFDSSYANENSNIFRAKLLDPLSSRGIRAAFAQAGFVRIDPQARDQSFLQGSLHALPIVQRHQLAMLLAEQLL